MGSICSFWNLTQAQSRHSFNYSGFFLVPFQCHQKYSFDLNISNSVCSLVPLV